MTDDPLLSFLRDFREPATARQLFVEVNSCRQHTSEQWADLPKDEAGFVEGLKRLQIAGKVTVDGNGKWRVVFVRPKFEAKLF